MVSQDDRPWEFRCSVCKGNRIGEDERPSVACVQVIEWMRMQYRNSISKNLFLSCLKPLTQLWRDYPELEY